MAETDGIVTVGDISVVRRRDPIVQIDHEEAKRAGRIEALSEVEAYVLDSLARVPRYESTLFHNELRTFLADLIRGA